MIYIYIYMYDIYMYIYIYIYIYILITYTHIVCVYIHIHIHTHYITTYVYTCTFDEMSREPRRFAARARGTETAADCFISTSGIQKQTTRGFPSEIICENWSDTDNIRMTPAQG